MCCNPKTKHWKRERERERGNACWWNWKLSWLKQTQIRQRRWRSTFLPVKNVGMCLTVSLPSLQNPFVDLRPSLLYSWSLAQGWSDQNFFSHPLLILLLLLLFLLHQNCLFAFLFLLLFYFSFIFFPHFWTVFLFSLFLENHNLSLLPCFHIVAKKRTLFVASWWCAKRERITVHSAYKDPIGTKTL